MHHLLRYKTFAFVALLCWLAVSGSGVYGHFCFDGQEPPVSMHLNVMGGHADSHAEESHVDMDVDLAKWLVAKLVKIDLSMLALLALVVVLLVNPQRAFFSFYSALYPRRISGIRPPLRAPPFFPA